MAGRPATPDHRGTMRRSAARPSPRPGGPGGAGGPAPPDHRGTMRRPAARPSAPPLIGVVTHELVAEPAPAWAPALERSERDRAPARLSLRLSYTQAIQEA